MKKINFIFIGECVIIAVLLVVIGVLLKTEDYGVGVKHVKATSMAEQKEDNKAKEKKGAQSVQKVVEKTENAQQETVEIQETQPVNTVTEEKEKAATEQKILTTKEVIERNKKTQIVVFGDSIWNSGEDEKGIAEYIMDEKDVIIYNCSIGGTTAAVYNESVAWDSWTSNSFNGMMYIANDILSEDDLIPNEKACQVFKEIDFNQVDYIIVSYGLNDYFSDIPIHPQEYYDLTSFVGALRHGVRKLQKKYPQAQIILTSPTYTEWFQGDRTFELGEYVEAARGVSAEYETHFLDMYHALGKNPDEKMQYLEDGVHLSKEGKALYARSVIDFLTSQGI